MKNWSHRSQHSFSSHVVPCWYKCREAEQLCTVARSSLEEVRSVSHRNTHVSKSVTSKLTLKFIQPRRNWISRACSHHAKQGIAAGYHRPYNTTVKNVWSHFYTPSLLSGKALPYIEQSLHQPNVAAENHQRNEDGVSNKKFNRKQERR
jgi:hypothetical protein